MQLQVNLAVALIFVLYCDSSAAIAGFFPPGFSQWFWQGSIVVGNWLYIDGGEIWASYTGQQYSPTWNMQTIAVDLTTDWTTSSIVTRVTNRTTAMSPMRRPDMYYDPTTNLVYSLGGEPYTVNGPSENLTQPVQLWSFEPSSDGNVVWQLEEAGTTAGFPLTSNVVHGTSATSPSHHYSLGGTMIYPVFDSEGNIVAGGQMAITQMITNSFASGSWTNETVSQYFVSGEAQFVPNFGDQGVVLFFGGIIPATSSIDGVGPSGNVGTIQIFDVASNSWHTQTASNAPIGRSSFCSVGVASPDNSTFEIFIFGGTQDTVPSSDTASALSTVYILTLPAFQWIEASDPAVIERSYHTCEVIGQRQMISIGGTQARPQSGWATKSDPWEGFQVFDMVDLTWTDRYNSSAAAYETPSLVQEYYANNPRYPSWSSTAVQLLFQDQAVSSSTPTPSATSRSSTGSNVGPIVGGVVGGVSVLALIGGAFWWYKRKHRYRPAPSQDRNSPPPVEMAHGDAHRKDVPVNTPPVYEMADVDPTAHELPAQER